MYQTMIREIAARIGRLGYDAGQIEAWMRLQYGTLDHLDRTTFRAEVEIACQCIDADPEGSKRLAETM